MQTVISSTSPTSPTSPTSKKADRSQTTHPNPPVSQPPPQDAANPSEVIKNSTDDPFAPPPRLDFAKPPRVMVIGAGSRGTAYAKAAKACSNVVIAGVCEPVEFKRKTFGRRFIWGDGEAREGQHFADWRDWVSHEQERRNNQNNTENSSGIDAVFICVLDEQHEEVICGIAGLGVHICCEKPLSTSLERCLNIRTALQKAWRSAGEKVFGICHVLRYSPHNMLLRELVRERGVVGEVVSLEHTEPVGWWHFSHSYVRGNWRKESTTAPSLLTKSCHDIDFILWLLCSPSSASSNEHKPHLPSFLTSTGTLNMFRRSRKPPQAGPATNCLSCDYEPSCQYSAKKIYLERHLKHGNTGWPVKIVDPEIEDLYKHTSPSAAEKRLLQRLGEDYTEDTSKEDVDARPWFGRCVWESSNDVCDDQHVTLTWDDTPGTSTGAKTASFHMIAHTESICQRRGRIYGTKGEIAYDSSTITVHDFASGETKSYRPRETGGGHGGGDEGLVRQFLRAVGSVEEGKMGVKEAQRVYLGCDFEEAFLSHAVVFAAEEARRGKRVVDWEGWWRGNIEDKGQ